MLESFSVYIRYTTTTTIMLVNNFMNNVRSQLGYQSGDQVCLYNTLNTSKTETAGGKAQK